jgi:hypothetical protein
MRDRVTKFSQCTLCLVSVLRLNAVLASVTHHVLLQRCREFPKLALPCYDEETLRSELRHTLFLPFVPTNSSGGTRVDVGVHHPAASHGGDLFTVVAGVYAISRDATEHPYLEIVMETALDSGFELHQGDTVAVCDGGEACLPCMNPSTSVWDAGLSACVCNPNARLTATQLASAKVFVRPGSNPETEGSDLIRFAERVQCEECDDYEVAVDGIDTDGNPQRQCVCAETFGRSTAVYELALGLPTCRCEKDMHLLVRRSSVTRSVSCAQVRFSSCRSAMMPARRARTARSVQKGLTGRTVRAQTTADSFWIPTTTSLQRGCHRPAARAACARLATSTTKRAIAATAAHTTPSVAQGAGTCAHCVHPRLLQTRRVQRVCAPLFLPLCLTQRPKNQSVARARRGTRKRRTGVSASRARRILFGQARPTPRCALHVQTSQSRQQAQASARACQGRLSVALHP